MITAFTFKIYIIGHFNTPSLWGFIKKERLVDMDVFALGFGIRAGLNGAPDRLHGFIHHHFIECPRFKLIEFIGFSNQVTAF